ncbi:MAG TPA: hypothetical protein VI756_07545, partial [Blastocatellia bacterium]
MTGRFIKDAFRKNVTGCAGSTLTGGPRKIASAKLATHQPSQFTAIRKKGAFRPACALLLLSICAPFANPALSAAAAASPAALEGAGKKAPSAAAASTGKSAAAASEAVAVATEARTHLVEKGYLAGGSD